MDGIDDLHGGDARGGGLRIVQATAEEQAAITQLLKERAAAAPGAAPAPGASALMSAGLRLAGVLFVVAGMGGGLGDLVHLHDSGGGPVHHAAVRREEESRKPKTENSNGEDGTEAVGTECEARAAMCAHRMPDGQCQRSKRQCRLFAAAGDAGESRKQKAENRDLGVAVPGVAARVVVKAVEAAMERFEGKLAGVRKDFADWQKSPWPANEAGQAAPPEPSQPEEPNLSLAAKVFQLLTALDPDNRLRKAPPIKVFLLRYRQNRSRTEIARTCRCDKSLIALRLRTIQEKLPWQPQQLQQMSAQVEAMQDAVSDSRATRIYRKGAAYGDEDGGGESD
jgi:hypothetical protein